MEGLADKLRAKHLVEDFKRLVLAGQAEKATTHGRLSVHSKSGLPATVLLKADLSEHFEPVTGED